MREEKEITLIDGGAERHFIIKQMSALKQEDWINRAVALLMAQSNENVGDIINAVRDQSTDGEEEKGFQMLLALFKGIKYEDVKGLYEELLDCVSYKPDASNNSFLQPLTKNNVDSIIQDVKTLYTLRIESFKLNFSFFREGLNEGKPETSETNSITIRKITPQSVANQE